MNTGTDTGLEAAATVNLRAPTAGLLFSGLPEIAEDMASRPEGAAADMPVLGFLRQLLDGPTPEEAVTFAAHALLPRHAVWWGHECLQSLPEMLSEEDRQMLALGAAWAARPDEDSRYHALEAGMAARAHGPGVWIALAAGWSGGSMAPRDGAEVPAPPYLAGRAVNAGVLSFLARVPQPARRARLRSFVSMAEILATSA